MTATLRVRARQGGSSTVTWRTKEEKDFAAGNIVRFDWPASTEWKEVKVELPAKGRVLHLRITPAQGSADLAVQSITLAPAKDGPVIFDFSKPATP